MKRRRSERLCKPRKVFSETHNPSSDQEFENSISVISTPEVTPSGTSESLVSDSFLDSSSTEMPNEEESKNPQHPKEPKKSSLVSSEGTPNTEPPTKKMRLTTRSTMKEKVQKKGKKEDSEDKKSVSIYNSVYLDYEFFLEHGIDIRGVLEPFGWNSICDIRDEVYVDIVKEFYWNLNKERKHRLESEVLGRNVNIGRLDIVSCFGLKDMSNDGDLAMLEKGQLYCLINDGDVVKYATRDPHVRNFPVYIRILHRIIWSCFLPRKGNTTLVTMEDAKIILALLHGHTYDLASHIIRHIHNLQASRPFGSVIIKLLEYKKFNFKREEHVIVSCQALGQAAFDKMGINAEGHVWKAGDGATFVADALALKAEKIGDKEKEDCVILEMDKKDKKGKKVVDEIKQRKITSKRPGPLYVNREGVIEFAVEASDTETDPPPPPFEECTPEPGVECSKGRMQEAVKENEVPPETLSSEKDPQDIPVEEAQPHDTKETSAPKQNESDLAEGVPNPSTEIPREQIQEKEQEVLPHTPFTAQSEDNVSSHNKQGTEEISPQNTEIISDQSYDCNSSHILKYIDSKFNDLKEDLQKEATQREAAMQRKFDSLAEQLEELLTDQSVHFSNIVEEVLRDIARQEIKVTSEISLETIQSMVRNSFELVTSEVNQLNKNVKMVSDWIGSHMDHCNQDRETNLRVLTSSKAIEDLVRQIRIDLNLAQSLRPSSIPDPTQNNPQPHPSLQPQSSQSSPIQPHLMFKPSKSQDRN